MAEKSRGGAGTHSPANDNRAADLCTHLASAERLDKVVLSVARLIGRQIARDHFAALSAANDNRTAADQSAGPMTGAEDREE